MAQILQDKAVATKFQILVEIAAAQTNIQQKDIARKLNVTPSPSNVLKSSFPEAWNLAKLEPDPSTLLPQLIDQLIALGQTAQQLRCVLNGNGHKHEKLSEITNQLALGGKHSRQDGQFGP